MNGVASYRLPARLDLSTATMLADGLRKARGADLVLDARDVTHLGTPGLQVMLSARRTWEEDGFALLVGDMPESFSDQLGPLGLGLADLATEPSDTADRDAVADRDTVGDEDTVANGDPVAEGDPLKADTVEDDAIHQDAIEHDAPDGDAPDEQAGGMLAGEILASEIRDVAGDGTGSETGSEIEE
ncbi:MAG: STAS domain-containing protein [Pseudomonadota bacterium]